MSGLVLRRANGSRRSGQWQADDFDIFDGDREVGRIYLVQSLPEPIWFWGVNFEITGRKSYGRAPTREAAMAAFRTEYAAWQAGQDR